MTTTIIFLIAQQCAGDHACIKYLSDCTWNITKSQWAVHKISDMEDRAKFSLSICEKQLERDSEWN